jgi:uncharacterized protein YggE
MISVVGIGRASAPPDVARVRLSATSARLTVLAAMADSEDAARRVREVLLRAGIAPSDAATVSLSVVAEQAWPEKHGQRITGFRSGHELLVTLRDLASVGRLIGGMLGAGGDDVRLNGVEFAVEDDGPLQVRARDAAWADAVRRAEQLAALAGCSLGRVDRIREQPRSGGGGPVPMRLAFAASDAGGPDVAVQPGDVSAEVAVSVRWHLA